MMLMARSITVKFITAFLLSQTSTHITEGEQSVIHPTSNNKKHHGSENGYPDDTKLRLHAAIAKVCNEAQLPAHINDYSWPKRCDSKH